MLQDCNNMLRAHEMEKAGLENQNQCFIEHIKIAQQNACNLELKDRELEYQLAKESLPGYRSVFGFTSEALNRKKEEVSGDNQ